ncbi:MAG: methionine--tRNA ligase, partial [Acidobacteriaceae bacterium]
VNARPHIGHAYSTIVCDVIARRKRLLGDDVWFLTGTDEHGQKIERSAKAANKTPQQFADDVSAEFRHLWQRMGLTNDDYIRTTEDRHKRGVQHLFSLLQQRGFIYKGTYTGQYCVSDEAYVEGPAGVVCPDCGRVTETVSEENYYFELKRFQQDLLDLYWDPNKLDENGNPESKEGKLVISPDSRRNEVVSFVKGGLKDLSVSRTSFNWGIPVPGDEKHVVYVWLDALANYITAIGYGSSDPADQAKFAKYWPAELHLIGKEISRFHCVYWPAFLLAAGLPLPKAVVANGWLLFEESKMSKSRGNVVRAETIMEAFGALKPELPKEEQDLFGADVLRYFLLREIPFGQDGSFSFDALQQRYNADLANGYGNLVSRTLAMIQKYFPEQTIPKCANPEEIRSDFEPEHTPSSVAKAFSDYVFHDALGLVWSLIGIVDGYITEQAPWKIAASEDETAKSKLAEILYIASESIRIITALLYPVMPYATAKVWAQLGLGDIHEAARKGELKNLEWGGLKPGTKLGELGPIFPRADKEIITRMSEIEQKNAPAAVAEAPVETKAEPEAKAEAKPAAPAPAKPAEPAPAAVATPATPAPAAEAAPADNTITIDDFAKVELRVAQIKVAERIPKADKLLRLEVDLGYETRQILSGIAEWYTPEDLIGRRIVVITNLAPRKMRGLETHGMLLAASEGDHGKPVLATFGEEIALGSRLK